MVLPRSCGMAGPVLHCCGGTMAGIVLRCCGGSMAGAVLDALTVPVATNLISDDCASHNSEGSGKINFSTSLPKGLMIKPLKSLRQD